MTKSELKAVSSMNETAANIMSFLSERRRNTVYTAFSGLRADMKKRFGKEVDRKEFDDTFKKLQSIGAGDLSCSKRGVCLGFNWSIPLRKIGTILKNQDEAGKPIEFATPSKEAPVVVPLTTKIQKASDSKKVTVVILRRRGEPKTIQIPEERLRALDLQ